ncbi:MAG TPA: YceI family protein [bacterium]|nr:YceI family protein [bacterium]
MHKLSVLMTAIALAAFTPLLLRADGTFSGNQLSQAYTPWYAQAASITGPVTDLAPGAGTLYNLQPGSSLYLVGNSTLHQYQMRAGTLLGSARVAAGDLAAGLKAGSAGPMALVVPLKDFKSRESGLDDNADKALKADQNPQIRFDLKGEKFDGQTLTAQGTLSVAGVAAPVTLSAAAVLKDGTLRLKGVQKLKMTDFKVTPPSISLLVTAITCTDQVEIHYDVLFAAASK